MLDLYLDGLDADEQLSAKTRFDNRHYSDDYVRPLLGPKKVLDLTPEAVVAWQRALTKGVTRLLPVAQAAGYGGSALNFHRLGAASRNGCGAARTTTLRVSNFLCLVAYTHISS